MRVHLVQHAQPLNDSLIQVNQFGFGKMVDINSHVLILILFGELPR